MLAKRARFRHKPTPDDANRKARCSEKSLIGVPGSAEPCVIREHERELGTVPSEGNQVGNVAEPGDGCDEEDSQGVNPCALVVPASALDEATTSNPGHARDCAERERHEIKGEDGSDREVGAKVAKNVA